MHSMNQVYFVRDETGAIKIGSTHNLSARLKALDASVPNGLELLGTIQTETRRDAYALEAQWHREFAAARLNGEWFVSTRALRDAIEANRD